MEGFVLVFLVVCFSLFVAIIFPQMGLADEIRLKNGDRLSGTILRKDDGTVAVKTSYAGTVKISFQEIESMSAEIPLQVLTKDKKLINVSTFVLKEKSGGPMLENEVVLDNVQYINPPPYITGKGMEWKGRVDLAASLADGNTDTESSRLVGEVVGRSKKNRYTVATTLNYAKDNNIETESNVAGVLKFDHFVNEKWYLTGNVDLLKDKYKDLHLRTIFGGGAGYQFRESRLLNVSAEAGIDYVREDYISSEDDEYPAARWAFAYDQFLFRETLQVFHNHKLNVGLEDTEDILLSARTGIRIPIISNINATLEVDVDWDNSPSADKKRTDTTYILGLGYTF